MTEMTPQQFRAWRQALDLSQPAAAEALGCSVSKVQAYEAGETRAADPADRRKVTIPLETALACTALWHRLPPWHLHQMPNPLPQRQKGKPRGRPAAKIAAE